MNTASAGRGWVRAIPRKHPGREARRSPHCTFHGAKVEVGSDRAKTVTRTNTIILIRKNQILAFADYRIIIPRRDIHVAETAEEIAGILKLQPV